MEKDAVEVVLQFTKALNEGDLEGVLGYLSEDTVFENTYPAPDGTRFVGKAATGDFWRSFLAEANGARFEVEEIFAAGEDRCVMRWLYRWTERTGQPGHIRGVDLYRVRDGLIVEKLSYVKG